MEFTSGMWMPVAGAGRAKVRSTLVVACLLATLSAAHRLDGPVVEYAFAQADCAAGAFGDSSGEADALLGPLSCAGDGCACPAHIGVSLPTQSDGAAALTSAPTSARLAAALVASGRGFTVEFWIRPGDDVGARQQLRTLVALEGAADVGADFEHGCDGGATTFRLSQRDGELQIDVAAAYADDERQRDEPSCFRVAAGGGEGGALLADSESLYHVAFVAPAGQLARLHVTRAAPGAPVEARAAESAVTLHLRGYRQVTVPFQISARPELWPAAHALTLGGGPRAPDGHPLARPPQLLYFAWHATPLSADAIAARARRPLDRSAPCVRDFTWAVREDEPAVLELREPLVEPSTFDSDFGVKAVEPGPATAAASLADDGSLVAHSAEPSPPLEAIVITSLPARGVLWEASASGARVGRPLSAADLPFQLGPGARVGYLSAQDDNDNDDDDDVARARAAARGERGGSGPGVRPAAPALEFEALALGPTGLHSARAARVRLRVAPVNDRPIAANVSVDVLPGGDAVRVPFAGSDVDEPGGRALRARLRSLPTIGTLVLRLPAAAAAAAAAAVGAGGGGTDGRALADGARLSAADLAAGRVPPLRLDADADAGCAPRTGTATGTADLGGACVEFQLPARDSAAALRCASLRPSGAELLCTDAFDFELVDAAGASSARPATATVRVRNPLRAAGGVTQLTEGASARLTLAALAADERAPADARVELVRLPTHGTLTRVRAAGAGVHAATIATAATTATTATAAAGVSTTRLRAGELLQLGTELEYTPEALYFNSPSVDPFGRALRTSSSLERAGLARPAANGGVGDDSDGDGDGDGGGDNDGGGESIAYRVISFNGGGDGGVGSSGSAGADNRGTGELVEASAVASHWLVVVNVLNPPTLTATADAAGGAAAVQHASALMPLQLRGLELRSADGDAALVRVRARCSLGLLTLPRAPRAANSATLRYELGDGSSDGALSFVTLPSTAAALLRGASYTSAVAGDDECVFEAASLLPPTPGSGGPTGAASAAAARATVRVRVAPLASAAGHSGSEQVRVRPVVVASVRAALLAALALCCLQLARCCCARAPRHNSKLNAAAATARDAGEGAMLVAGEGEHEFTLGRRPDLEANAGGGVRGGAAAQALSPSRRTSRASSLGGRLAACSSPLASAYARSHAADGADGAECAEQVPSSRARLLLEQPRARELRPWLHDSRRPDEPPTSRLPRAPPVAPPASALEARARRASQQASERATDRLQRRAAAGATSGVTKARERGSGSACTTDRSSLASSSSASGGASSRSGEASGRRAPVASACAASYDDRAVDGFYTTRSTTDGRDGSRAPSTARSRCAEQY